MSSAQGFEDEVFRLYNKEGVQLTFAEAMDLMANQEVVLFGEFHDNALIHWLQLRTAQALHQKAVLVIGGEMWETDGQLLLDEYLMGLVNEKTFKAEARLWPNYETDYAPIVTFAKENGLPVAATNVPRRYASLVAREGLDTLMQLPEASQLLLPELPIAFSLDTPGYEEMMDMMGGHGMNFKPENFVQAQALKDAAMAENILRYLKPNSTFLHLNGDFHSANYGGIYWYLKRLKPELKVITLKVYAEHSFDFDIEKHQGGDIVLIVPADFTKTH